MSENKWVGRINKIRTILCFWINSSLFCLIFTFKELEMPLPFILGAAAIAAASYGAKKGYDGYQVKDKADSIIELAKSSYESAKANFDKISEETMQKLDDLGSFQLQIGRDFGEFRALANELLCKLEKAQHKDLKFALPSKNRLDKIEAIELSAIGYLGKIAGAGVVGAAAAYSVYGGVLALGAASTGTAISTLSGVAAYNATLAAIGGGSIATGGLGMAGGAAILGSVAAAPVLAIAGWTYNAHAEKALEHALKVNEEVKEAIGKMAAGNEHFFEIQSYTSKVLASLTKIYAIFTDYFGKLKFFDAYLNNGFDIDSVEKEMLLSIENGYLVSAILADIISTPLFKFKTNDSGNVVVNEENVPVMATDAYGYKVVNREGIDKALSVADSDIEQFSS